MKMQDAIELNNKWRDKPCNHPRIEKEVGMSGNYTGDYVCSQCGKTIDEDKWEEEKRRLKPDQ